MAGGEIRWLDPVWLDFDEALGSKTKFLRQLRGQMLNGIREQRFPEKDINRCVYVIRMYGDFIISYANHNSPVLYIGRGNATSRLGSHLSRWLSSVHEFTKRTTVEIRIVVPRCRNRPQYYKNVEADLIRSFKKKHGNLPFFNSRLETSFEDRVTYSKNQTRQLGQLLSVGKRHRPIWAVKPTPANASYATYLKGSDP